MFSTHGIVLNHIRYAETSIVVHIYTQMFGRQSYIINGVRSTGNKGKSIFLQPLSLLALEVYHNPKKEIQRIKDFRILYPFKSLPFDQHKRSIAFFLTEVFNKALREEEENLPLFNLLYSNIIKLDAMHKGYQHMHFTLLATLTRHLGFFPHFEQFDPSHYFDLRNGSSSPQEPPHPYFLSPPISEYWHTLFLGTQQEELVWNCPSAERLLILQAMVDYYALHLEGFGQIKSLEILFELYGRY
jgi:DNA repair protein RecO (recombination protein O)